MLLDENAAVATPRLSLAGPLLVAAWLGLGLALAWAPAGLAGLLTFAFVMVGWILAVALHEFGHALVAHLAGDHTVATRGYLSFDPRRYADLGTTLVIPLIALALGGIGFPGGAVYIREDLMRSRVWRSAASLAGPAGTLVVLVLISLGLRLMATAPGQEVGPLVPALAFLGFLQATALILNLLPIPGLDGFGAIRPFLPRSLRAGARKIEPVAMLGLLALIFFVPAVAAEFFGLAFGLSAAAGLPLEWVRAGYSAFRFWG